MTDPTRRSPGRRAAGAWHVWLPILALVALCLPRLTLHIPAAMDHSEEIYQPMQTLKFFASGGQAFDKYGPALNFVLAPFYAATLAYFKLTGTLGRPAGEWPYGFADPLRQIGTLIVQTRVVCLALTAAMVGVFSQACFRATRDRAAAALVTLMLVVGNYAILWNAPFGRPDTGMVAFLGISLAIVLRIASDGPTLRRSLSLGFFSAASAGSKENVGAVLAATILATYAHAWWAAGADRSARASALRQLGITVAAGALFYGLTNVVYAPHIWWARAQYWLFGDGLSGDVWARSKTVGQHLDFAWRAVWNNLGPAGAIVTPIAVVAALVHRRAWTLVLCVPVVASAVIVMQIPYTPDRFVLPGTLALAFPVALGVAALARGRWRAPTLAAVALAAGVNLWWSTITLHLAASTEQAVLERAAAGDDASATKAYATMFEASAAVRRLEYLGHRVDPRPMQAWVDPTRPPPTIVYGYSGRMQMIEEAKRMPGRAKYFESLAGFSVADWPGMAALGYAPPGTFEVPVPAYLRPLRFMPLFIELRHRQLRIYRLRHPETRPAATRAAATGPR